MRRGRRSKNKNKRSRSRKSRRTMRHQKKVQVVVYIDTAGQAKLFSVEIARRCTDTREAKFSYEMGDN